MTQKIALNPVFLAPPGFRARRSKRRWAKVGRSLTALLLIGAGCAVAAMTNEVGADLACVIRGCETSSDWSVTEAVRPVFPVAARPAEKFVFVDI